MTESSAVTRDEIDRALEAMWCGPEPPFSWWRKPPRRLNLFPLTGGWARQLERSKWQEAGHSEWIESIRTKVQSAAYATDQGWSWSWDAPGVYGRPELSQWMQVRDFGPPAYLPHAPHREDEDYHHAR